MSSGNVARLIDARQRMRSIDRIMDDLAAERADLVKLANELDPVLTYHHRTLSMPLEPEVTLKHR